tara:strand:+ start:19045 stop:20751 length:1707 start_codon:yes stop_codon:yes gene_type:complete
MCSVDGFTGKHNFTLAQYAAFNADRGPDGTNYWQDDYVSIAHSLLSIQDNPNGSIQPLEKGNKVLSYNGEIYGIDSFDTEYLMDVLDTGNWSKLKYETNGMWGFSLYDKDAQTVTLCRDHLGVKALYYVIVGKDLFWSSTMKPLIAVLQQGQTKISSEHNYKHTLDFLDGFWLSPETQYGTIRRVPPGAIMTWSIKDGCWMNNDNLWGAGQRFNLEPNPQWDVDEYRELMLKSMRETCHAPDIRKCVSLSGGLDSNLIVSMNRRTDNLFCSSVSFEDHVDHTTKVSLMKEHELAAKTCQMYGLDHTTTEIKKAFEHELDETVTRIGGYMWLASRIIPRMRNAKNAAEHGAKIYIVGDLADEILTGYSGHAWYGMSKENPRPRNNHFIDPYLTPWSKYEGFFDKHHQSHFKAWYPKHLHGTDHINNHMFWRLMQSVDSFNGLVDTLAGSFGMESRVPFMNQELVKYVMKIPSHHKLRTPNKQEIRAGHSVIKPPVEDHFDRDDANIHTGYYKRLIREDLCDWMPDHINNNVNKVGFSTPWNSRNHELNNRLRIDEADHSFKVLANTFQF